MIVPRKKAFNTLKLLIGIILVGFWYLISILMLSDPTDIAILIFGIILLLLSIFGTFGIIFTLFKLLSDYPEFELTAQDFIVNDNLKYHKIPLKDIVDCEVVYQIKGPELLALHLNDHSNIKGNASRRVKFINDLPRKVKIVLLTLEFADIVKEELIEIIKERISTQKHSS